MLFIGMPPPPGTYAGIGACAFELEKSLLMSLWIYPSETPWGAAGGVPVVAGTGRIGKLDKTCW